MLLGLAAPTAEPASTDAVAATTVTTAIVETVEEPASAMPPRFCSVDDDLRPPSSLWHPTFVRQMVPPAPRFPVEPAFIVFHENG
jgi:hypothetical protein